MADIIDDANEAAETHLRASISHRMPTGPEANGYCYNCNEKLESAQRWCDAACRDDWEKAIKAEQDARRRV